MTTANPSFTLSHDALTAYASNVADAMRGLFAAVMAKRPRAPELSEDRYVREKASSRRELFAMAFSYDEVNPSLAAELRFIASR